MSEFAEALSVLAHAKKRRFVHRFTKEERAKGGRVTGAKNIPLSARSRGGKKGGAASGKTKSFGCKKGRHTRDHVNHGIVKAGCAFCVVEKVLRSR
jgi:hypothetical protein